MAEPLESTLTEDEVDFQKTVFQIGGRERLYLVSEPLGDKDEQDESGAEIVREFIRDMFPGSLAEGCLQSRFFSAAAGPRISSSGSSDAAGAKQPNGSDDALTLVLKHSHGAEEKEELSTTSNGSVQRSSARRGSSHCSQRAIDSPVIVFLFRETYLSKIPNHVCLKEILKDVKARTRRASIARPALIGLISAGEDNTDTRLCSQVLELQLRSVFHRHSSGTIWVGTYIPSDDASVLGIKRNACRVIRASQTDNTRHREKPIYCPFQCFSWPRRRGARGQTNNSASKENANSGSTEESIPLKTKPLSAGSPEDEDAAAGDS